MRSLLLFLLLLLMTSAALGMATPAAAAGVTPSAPSFRVQFQLALRAGNEAGDASLRVVQAGGALRQLDLAMPATTFTQIGGDGRIRRSGDRLLWDIPARGGELRYRVQISHRRAGKGFDALVTESWAVLRAEDAFPGATARLTRGARGSGELRLLLPAGWSSFTPYPANPAGVVIVPAGDRSFPRPIGWMIAGHIGSRMDLIAGTSVRVAAPRGTPAPRVPMLALLRATLPILQRRLASLPEQLLLVTAGDPMWRGGLSAPNSLFLHADRPLLSENATSPVLHEIVHVVAPVPTAPDADWIDEGIAEYLSLRLLRDSDTISRERFAHAIRIFRKRGARARSLNTPVARGDITARAVAVFADIDNELQELTAGKADIFTLTRRMMQEQRPIDARRLRELATEISAGRTLRSLGRDRVAGGTACETPSDLITSKAQPCGTS